MRIMKKLMENKIFKTVKLTIQIILGIFFVTFILMVCLQRFSGNKVSFFDYRMFTVVSGSMEPRYNIGDVLISKDIAPSKIKVGDTISYLGAKGSFMGKVITHEVVSIETDTDGKYSFHTQGLTNLVEDPIVYENQLYGKVMYKSKILSFVYKFVSTSYGLFICVVIPLLYIIGSEMLGFLLAKEEKRRNNL